MASFQFSLRAAAGLFVVSSISLLGATSVMTGCSDDSSGEAEDAGPAQCPTSIAAAGAACDSERMACSVSYECGNGQFLRETAECTCTNKVWACVDPSGNAIAAGQTPACTTPGGGNDKSCPAAETEGALCGTAGLVCTYSGATCPGNPNPNLDTCQCESTLGDGGFTLHCEPATCPPPPVDGGAPDADAG